MSLRVLIYRLYRLRRLIFVTVALPVAVVAGLWALKGTAALAFLPLAVLGPLFHVLKYPKAAAESVAVSLTLTLLLALAGTIGPDVALAGLALRILGLGVLGVVLFLSLSMGLSAAMFAGPEKEFTARAHRKSRLDPQALKERITLYPGREDDRVVCGPARSDGVFPITMKHSMPDLSEAGMEEVEVSLFGLILTDLPEQHEVISIPEEGEETSTTQYSFIEQRKGTRVEIAERSLPVPLGIRVGYWLEDYMADYLTDEVDRAEGREMRANRFQPHHQLMIDFFRLFPKQDDSGPTPAE